MDSTVYRRRSDGQLVGTPENSSLQARPVADAVEVEIVHPTRDANWQPPAPAPKPQPIAKIPARINTEIDVTGVMPKLKADSNTDPAEGTVYRSSQRVTLPKLPLAASKVMIFADSGQKTFQNVVKANTDKVAKTGFAFGLTRFSKFARAVILFYVVFFFVLGYKTSHAFETTNAYSPTPIADTRGTNWLLVGSDSRKGLSAKEIRQLHTGPDEGNARTDVIMIVHIDSKGGTTLVSLPRDSYVKIPSHTSGDGTKVGDRKNKINAAYTFGGAPLLVKTIEANTGLHIDHYMEIGFAGIHDVTDAIGGVNICVPRNYSDKNSNLHVRKGCQNMNGKVALAYVRMRYADPTGDIGRIQRQQQYLSAVMHKVLTPGTVLNPLKMWSLSSAGTSSVVVGKGTGIKDIGRLGLAMKGLSGGSGKVLTVPVSDTSATTAAGSSVLWDKAKAAALFAKLGATR